MKPFKVGEFSVSSIIEREGPIRPPGVMFPTSVPEVAARHLSELGANTWSPTSGILYNTYQTFVVRRGNEVVVIDTCVGENKARPPHFNYSKQPWLDGFVRQRLAFEDVGAVINTHLHVDHCGWNTRLVNGRWVATFPRATYYMGRVEYDYWGEQTAQGWELPGRIWTDSALPLVTSGQAKLVEANAELGDGIRLWPTPGHTPGHFCVSLESRGERAIFIGDLMHHPLQCREPEWSSCFCVDQIAAARTRRQFFEQVADSGIIIVPEHFPYPTAGRIFSDGNAFRWKFLDQP
jgi:glyoxylase-like metal-dependent hydrolase (beta-lactamase superfamily II)